MIEYGELSFKVVRLESGGQEVIARAGNYEICKAAFDKALFIYPAQHLELRQGARDLQVEGGGLCSERAPRKLGFGGSSHGPEGIFQLLLQR
jgi:hypothetical protein